MDAARSRGPLAIVLCAALLGSGCARPDAPASSGGRTIGLGGRARSMVIGPEGLTVAFHLEDRIATTRLDGEAGFSRAATVGPNPRALVRATRRGETYFVTANTTGASMTWVRAEDLTLLQTRPVDAPPIALAARDVDGDGVDELAVVSGIDGGVIELRAFDGAVTRTCVEEGARAIAFVDTPRGAALATISESTGRLAVLDRRDCSVLTAHTLCREPFAIASHGERLAIACLDGSAVIVEGDDTEVLTGGTSLYDITFADFDGDGAIDVAAADRGQHTVLVWRGTGRTYAAPRAYAVGRAPIALAAKDANDDGASELVVLAFESRDIHILELGGNR